MNSSFRRQILLFGLLISTIYAEHFALKKITPHSLGKRTLDVYDILMPKSELIYHWGNDPEQIRDTHPASFSSVRTHTLTHYDKRYIDVESIESMLDPEVLMCRMHFRRHKPTNDSSLPKRPWTITLAFQDSVAYFKAKDYWQGDDLLFVFEHGFCHAGHHERSIYKPTSIIFHNNNFTVSLPEAIPVVPHHDGSGHREGDIPNTEFAGEMSINVGPRRDHHSNLRHSAPRTFLSRRNFKPVEPMKFCENRLDCLDEDIDQLSDKVMDAIDSLAKTIVAALGGSIEKVKADMVDMRKDPDFLDYIDAIGEHIDETWDDIMRFILNLFAGVFHGELRLLPPKIEIGPLHHYDWGHQHDILGPLKCRECYTRGGHFTLDVGLIFNFHGNETWCNDLDGKNGHQYCSIRKHIEKDWFKFEVLETIELGYQLMLVFHENLGYRCSWMPPAPPTCKVSQSFLPENLQIADGLAVGTGTKNKNFGDLDTMNLTPAEKEAAKALREKFKSYHNKDGLSVQPTKFDIGVIGEVALEADLTIALPGIDVYIEAGSYGHVNHFDVHEVRDTFKPQIRIRPLAIKITNPTLTLSLWVGIDANVEIGAPQMAKVLGAGVRIDLGKNTWTLGGETNTDKHCRKPDHVDFDKKSFHEESNALKWMFGTGLYAHLDLFGLTISTDMLATKSAPWRKPYFTLPLPSFCFACTGNDCIANWVNGGFIAINGFFEDLAKDFSSWITEKFEQLVDGEILRGGNKTAEASEVLVPLSHIKVYEINGTKYRLNPDRYPTGASVNNPYQPTRFEATAITRSTDMVALTKIASKTYVAPEACSWVSANGEIVKSCPWTSASTSHDTEIHTFSGEDINSMMLSTLTDGRIIRIQPPYTVDTSTYTDIEAATENYTGITQHNPYMTSDDIRPSSTATTSVTTQPTAMTTAQAKPSSSATTLTATTLVTMGF